MGVVYDAHHQLLDRRVAVKVLAPEVLANREAVARFLNEARAAARISTPHVVQVLDVGMLDGGLPFMVMERLEGTDLAEVLKRESPLGIPRAVDLLLEGIEGVAHAHLEGVLHRDLKPSNFFLARRSDGSTLVKVLDFGISKVTGGAGGSVTSTNAVLGSPLYMSPEQLLSTKNIDTRADVWSLGVIGYELVTGTTPFDGDNLVALFAAIQERDPRPMRGLRPDVPPGLDDAVCRCLRRKAGERFTSVFELARALRPFGTARGHAVLARLEAHVSSKGLSFESVCSTEPLPPVQAATQQSSGQPPAPLSTARTQSSSPELSGPPSMAPPTRISGAIPAPPTGRTEGATSAPWSSTGTPNARASGGRRAAVIGLGTLGLLAAVAGTGFAVRARQAPAPAGQTSMAASEAPAAAAASTASSARAPDPVAATSTSAAATPSASAVAAVTAATAQERPRRATVAAPAQPPPSSLPAAPAAPPPVAVAPAPPQPVSAKPKPTTNPLEMKPITQ
jgi:serine/threonine-protein kinase